MYNSFLNTIFLFCDHFLLGVAIYVAIFFGIAKTGYDLAEVTYVILILFVLVLPFIFKLFELLIQNKELENI
jgi:hypothetical protein